jgi:hypothetical protein
VVETVREVVFTAGTGGRAPRPQVNGFMRSLMLVSERGIDARRRIRLPAGENRRPDRRRPLPAPGLPSGPLRWRWSPRCWRERSSDRGLRGRRWTSASGPEGSEPSRSCHSDSGDRHTEASQRIYMAIEKSQKQ